MTLDEFRTLALALPEAIESAHFDHPDFRVSGKIFATLQPEHGRAVVKLPLDEMLSLTELDPRTFSGAKGWAKSGWTVIELARAKPAHVRELLDTAWRQVAPKKLAKQHPR